MGPKPVAHRLTEAVQIGNHTLRFSVRDDPRTLTTWVQLRCRGCRMESFMTYDIRIQDSATEAALKLEDTVLKVVETFANDIDQDCPTAALMVTVSEVHER